MSFRSPSGFTTWVDERSLTPGKEIKDGELDNVFNDIERFVRARQLRIADYFGRWQRSSGSHGTPFGTALRWYDAQDLCDIQGGSLTTTWSSANEEVECDVYIRAWVEDYGAMGGVTAEFQVTTGATSGGTATVSTSSTTPGWITTTIWAAADGSEQTWDLTNKITSGTVGTDHAVCDAFLVVSRYVS